MTDPSRRQVTAALAGSLVAVATGMPARAASSPRPGGATATATTGTAWPLSVSADRRAFRDAKGRTTFIAGDTAWSLMVSIKKPAVLRYLDDRVARGVNVIIVNLIEHAFSRQNPAWKNAYGVAPFRRVDDFTTTVDAYFDHAEWVVAEAQKRGIGVLLAPAYMGASCGGEGWCVEMRANGVQKLEAYGRDVGARFGRFRNVIWMHAGDHAPVDEDLALAQAVRRGIEATAGKALHTYHYQPDMPPQNDTRLKRLDFDTLYSYNVGTIADFVLWARMRDAGRMPFVFVEGVYENEHESRPQDWREPFYATMLGGGAGFVFGNNPIWGFGRGWTGELDGPGSRALSIAARFFRSISWRALRPESGNAIVSGLGDPKQQGAALASANAAHSLVLVYFTARRTVTVAAGSLAGPVTARWFDPATGRYRAISGSPFQATGTVSFTPPADRVDGSSDWILVLTTA